MPDGPSPPRCPSCRAVLSALGATPELIDAWLASDGDGAVRDELRGRWSNVADIRAGVVWDHKGVEYDAVVVRADAMTPSEICLAASRAAHELVILR